MDTTKDVVEGTWNLKDGVLSCASGRNVRVQLPYRAPDEYDLRVTFVRQAGSGPVALLLTARGEAFGLELDAKSHVARFEMINKKIAAENPSSVACTLENGTAYTVVVQVRREGVKATLDGKALTQWATDYKDMSRYSVWKLKDERLLGIGASSAEVVFRRVEVVEVKGEGKKIR